MRDDRSSRLRSMAGTVAAVLLVSNLAAAFLLGLRDRQRQPFAGQAVGTFGLDGRWLLRTEPFRGSFVFGLTDGRCVWSSPTPVVPVGEPEPAPYARVVRLAGDAVFVLDPSGVAADAAECDLRRVPLAGGPERVVASVGRQAWRDGWNVSADGHRLFVLRHPSGREGSRLEVLDARSGTLIAAATFPKMRAPALASVGPDGRSALLEDADEPPPGPDPPAPRRRLPSGGPPGPLGKLQLLGNVRPAHRRTLRSVLLRVEETAADDGHGSGADIVVARRWETSVPRHDQALPPLGPDGLELDASGGAARKLIAAVPDGRADYVYNWPDGGELAFSPSGNALTRSVATTDGEPVPVWRIGEKSVRLLTPTGAERTQVAPADLAGATRWTAASSRWRKARDAVGWRGEDQLLCMDGETGDIHVRGLGDDSWTVLHRRLNGLCTGGAGVLPWLLAACIAVGWLGVVATTPGRRSRAPLAVATAAATTVLAFRWLAEMVHVRWPHQTALLDRMVGWPTAAAALVAAVLLVAAAVRRRREWGTLLLLGLLLVAVLLQAVHDGDPLTGLWTRLIVPFGPRELFDAALPGWLPPPE